MGRVFLLCWGLLVQTPSVIQAQIAQSGTILGPDGRGPAPLAPKPGQPTLEEQLLRRKHQEALKPLPLPAEPAMSSEELLSPEERQSANLLQESMNLKPVHPRFRMHLGLAPTRAQKLKGPADSFRFDPGLIWQSGMRLTNPEKSFTFWTGLYLAAWNGHARSASSFSRFAALHAGPLFAIEWSGTPRQNLAFGFSGVNRQADPDFPGHAHRLATKRFGFEGSGLWVNYGLSVSLGQGFEWETKIGMQSSSSYMLTYLSFGVTLWTD